MRRRSSLLAVRHLVDLAGQAGVILAPVAVLARARQQGSWFLAGCAVVSLLGAVIGLYTFDRMYAAIVLLREQVDLTERANAELRRPGAKLAHPATKAFEIDPVRDAYGEGWRVPYKSLRLTPVGTPLTVTFRGTDQPAASVAVTGHDPASYPIVRVP